MLLASLPHRFSYGKFALPGQQAAHHALSVVVASKNTRRLFASRNKTKNSEDENPEQTTLAETKRRFERDNRTVNRAKAEAFDNNIVQGSNNKQAVSKEQLKCRSTKDVIHYAEKAGATVTINSNHVKVSKNGVTTGFQSPGKKCDLNTPVRKLKIEAFQAMGIAWDIRG